MSHDGSLDFSFSGLKTALVYAVRDLGAEATAERRADLAASFQSAVVGQLVAKLRRAIETGGREAVALGGGVAANALLRERTAELCAERGVRLKLVPPELCTDNAAMIGSAARTQRADRLSRLSRPRRRRPLGLPMPTDVITLYGRPGCHLCDEARVAIEGLRREGATFELREVDIETDPGLHRRPASS